MQPKMYMGKARALLRDLCERLRYHSVLRLDATQKSNLRKNHMKCIKKFRPNSLRNQLFHMCQSHAFLVIFMKTIILMQGFVEFCCKVLYQN